VVTSQDGAAAPQPETWQDLLETLLPMISAGSPADHATMLAGLIVQLQLQVAELSGITEAHGIMLRRLIAAAMTRPGTS
jgi:hypothetical protein